MAELIAISPDSAVALTATLQPITAEWTRQVQFGMTFEEQQEVLYQTLMAFQEPEQQ